MLQWFRGRARVLAAGVLCSLATIGALSLTAHEVECDDAAEGVFRVHDPAGHAVGVPSGDGQSPLHCLLCHWAQSFRADTVRDSGVEIERSTYPSRSLAHVRSVRSAVRLNLPSRAPPA